MNKIARYILHWLLLLWKWLFSEWEPEPEVQVPDPARELHHLIMSEENNNMVKYKLSWVPSSSPWAVSQEVKGTVAGSAASFATGLNMAVNNVEVTVAEGSLVDWFVVTTGENGLTADSVHDSFTAQNMSVPEAATGLAHEFVSFVP